MDTFKISSLDSEDLIQDGWSNQLIFFAFPQQIKDDNQIKYYVDSAQYPHRHRLRTTYYSGGETEMSNWVEELTFWAFTEPKPETQAYTVLYANIPYRSQIVEGNAISISGWEFHSVFWAYSKPGEYFYTIIL